MGSSWIGFFIPSSVLNANRSLGDVGKVKSPEVGYFLVYWDRDVIGGCHIRVDTSMRDENFPCCRLSYDANRSQGDSGNV